MSTAPDIVAVIQTLIADSGLTQNEIAARCGVAQDLVSRIKRGLSKSENIPAQTVTRLLRGLGYPPTKIGRTLVECYPEK